MTGAAAVALVLAANLVGLVLVPLGLPGIWLQVAAAAVTAAATGGAWIGWEWVGVMLGLALAGELVEFVSGQWGAARFGGSRRAGWGALVGGILGALVGGIPVPIVGAIVMSFVGTFVGALAGELSLGRRPGTLRVGVGAVLGRVVGVAAKLGCGLAILVVTAVRLLAG